MNNSATIIRIAALGLLGGMILSPALWGFADRQYFPLLPLFGAASDIQASMSAGILALISLVAVLFLPKNKLLLSGTIAFFLLLSAFDLNRLQPWMWCYLLVFATGIRSGKNPAFHVLLAGLYCWSGFNKLTPYFAEDNFRWFCEAFSLTKNLADFSWLGYGLALLEMSFGAALLWPKTRKTAAFGLIALHLVIVAFLLKLHWNLVVIPWNLALAAMLWHVKTLESESLSATEKWQLAPLSLAWAAPLFYFFGLWPQPLSWQLYSNTQPEATFYTASAQPINSPELSAIWHKYAFDEGQKLLLDDWASGALNVPVFASDMTFEKTARYLCTQSVTPDSSGLYILRVNPWDRSKENLIKIPCTELGTDL